MLRQCLEPSYLIPEAFSIALDFSYAQWTLLNTYEFSAFMNLVVQAAGARVPHAQPGERWRAGESTAMAEGVRHLVARPLWQLQV